MARKQAQIEQMKQQAPIAGPKTDRICIILPNGEVKLILKKAILPQPKHQVIKNVTPKKIRNFFTCFHMQPYFPSCTPYG